MTDILAISTYVTLRNADHAGGKVNYWYMQKLGADHTLTFISKFSKAERASDWRTRTLNGEYRIINAHDYRPTFFKKCMNKIIHIMRISYYVFFFDWYTQCYYRAEIKRLKKEGYRPETVILDWTQCVFLSKTVRKVFPKARIIAVEQDVTFLSYERRIVLAQTQKQRKIARKHYEIIKKHELHFLSYADQINVLNCKDADLLITNAVPPSKIKVISPYYDDYSTVTRKPNSTEIVFYGAMSRKENYECCIWFIKNVLNRLPSCFTFTIIGSHPHESLQAYVSDRVRVTGFIADVTPYFESALCSVVPLLLGAGIKIKVLESMSAGIPVLTNAIGIEGIPAKAGSEYLHCESAEDYVAAIERLAADKSLQAELCQNARIFVRQAFDYKRDSYI